MNELHKNENYTNKTFEDIKHIDENGMSIKVVRYAGTNKVDLLENYEFGYCSLIKATKNVIDKMTVENKRSAKITPKERIEKNLVDAIALKEALEDLKVPVVIYKGNMGKKKTKEIQDLLREADEKNKPRIILATSSSIGEGFDDNRLDTLFLTMPVSWKERIIQYVGRLHREHEDKGKVIVYDYLDNTKVLEKMYNRRLKGYKIAGYDIIE